MSSAADNIRANAERLRAKTPAKSATGNDEAATPTVSAPARAALVPAPVTAVRQKNVRRTVDLSPTTHRALDNLQRDTADRLGLARVTGQDVLAALVDRLLNDSELAEQITAAIASSVAARGHGNRP